MGKLSKWLRRKKRAQLLKELQEDCKHFKSSNEICKECELEKLLKPNTLPVNIYIGNGKTCKHGLSLESVCAECEVKKIMDVKEQQERTFRARYINTFKLSQPEFEGWEYY